MVGKSQTCLERRGETGKQKTGNREGGMSILSSLFPVFIHSGGIFRLEGAFPVARRKERGKNGGKKPNLP